MNAIFQAVFIYYFFCVYLFVPDFFSFQKLEIMPVESAEKTKTIALKTREFSLPSTTSSVKERSLHEKSYIAASLRLGKEDLKKKLFDKKPKEIKEVCTEVRPSIEKTCYKTTTVTKAYNCFDTIQRQECEDVPVTIPKTCLKTFEEKVPYECVRKEYQNDCRPSLEMIEDLCVRLEMRKETYPCPTVEYQTSCIDVPIQVVDVCFKTVQKPFPYECSKERVENECRQVPVETESICEQTVMVKSPYDCSVTEYVTDCSKANSTPENSFSQYNPFLNEASRIQIQSLASKNAHISPGNKVSPLSASDTAVFAKQREIKKIEAQNVAPEMQEASVTRTSMTEVSASPKNEVNARRFRALGIKKKRKEEDFVADIGAICTNVPVTVHKTCYYDDAAIKSYPCLKKQMKTSCQPVKVVEPDTCFELRPVQESYECQKTEMKKDCKQIPVQVDKTCEREIPYEKQFACEVTNYRTECVPKAIEVPDTCFKGKPSTESYPCPETTIQHVCKTVPHQVQKTCTKNEQVQIPYKCEEVEVRQLCYFTREGNDHYAMKKNHEELPPIQLFSSPSAGIPFTGINDGVMYAAPHDQIGRNQVYGFPQNQAGNHNMFMTPQGDVPFSQIQMLPQGDSASGMMYIVPNAPASGNYVQEVLQGEIGDGIIYGVANIPNEVNDGLLMNGQPLVNSGHMLVVSPGDMMGAPMPHEMNGGMIVHIAPHGKGGQMFVGHVVHGVPNNAAYMSGVTNYGANGTWASANLFGESSSPLTTAQATEAARDSKQTNGSNDTEEPTASNNNAEDTPRVINNFNEDNTNAYVPTDEEASTSKA